jgi:hypothetical protein
MEMIMKRLRKVPIQIYLEPEQDKVLCLLSKSSGKSKAAIIRSCISRHIAGLPLENDPALNIMKLGSSGKTDISERHDDYLISLEK